MCYYSFLTKINLCADCDKRNQNELTKCKFTGCLTNTKTYRVFKFKNN